MLPLLEHDEHAVVGFRRAETVDAGNGSDDDYVTALEKRACRAHAQLVELVVNGGFFFDVDVGGGNISFGLVKIVIADEIFDGIIWEKTLEFVIKLRSQGLVMREDKRGTIHSFDDLGHREGLARTGDPEQDLVFVTGFDSADELVDGRGLVAARLVAAAQSKFHGRVS